MVILALLIYLDPPWWVWLAALWSLFVEAFFILKLRRVFDRLGI